MDKITTIKKILAEQKIDYRVEDESIIVADRHGREWQTYLWTYESLGAPPVVVMAALFSTAMTGEANIVPIERFNAK